MCHWKTEALCYIAVTRGWNILHVSTNICTFLWYSFFFFDPLGCVPKFMRINLKRNNKKARSGIPPYFNPQTE